MTSRPESQCLSCVWFTSPLDGHPQQTCKAYEDGIPDVIWWNRFDHRERYRGDEGLVWESFEGAEFPEWAMADEGEVERATGDWSRHPHPGQRYRHGWKPIGVAALEEVGEYAPGEWKRILRDEAAEVEKELRGYVRVAKMDGRTPDAAELAHVRALLEAEVAGRRETRVTLRNGEHEITYPAGELSPEDVQRVTAFVDHLQRVAPVKPLRLSFTTTPFSDDEGNPQPYVMGRTERGTGTIAMQVKALGEWDPPMVLRPEGWFMPSAEDPEVDQFEYILAHEWGHAVDHWDRSQLVRMWTADVGMSHYGRKNFLEGVAEAFADWVLTRGHPTTPVGQKYAEVFEEEFSWQWGGQSPWD